MVEKLTIRVTVATRDRLDELAQRRGLAACVGVAELVQQADDRAMLDAALHGWERIAADEDALAAYRAETRELEAFDGPIPGR
jgi:hypothetical protein